MSKNAIVARTSILTLLFLWGASMAPPAAKSATKSGPSLNLALYDSIVDEQDTTAFYNNGIRYCSSTSTPLGPAGFSGDSVSAGSTSAYGFGAPWTLSPGLTSTLCSDGTDCGATCLRAQLSADLKVLNLDTRGTSPLRTLALDFTQPCTDPGCPPAGSSTVFGGHLATPGLLNVTLSSPYTSMAVCSSVACPEAQTGFGKFWFTDPNDSSVTWRVDWRFLRILRMSASTWYVVADACDGTQIAGLSKLTGSRTNPKVTFNGSYKIPFFLAAVTK